MPPRFAGWADAAGAPVRDDSVQLFALFALDRLAEIARQVVSSADAMLAARLPRQHRDPFDRVIVAQALRRNLTIATRDSRILDAALTPTLQA